MKRTENNREITFIIIIVNISKNYRTLHASSDLSTVFIVFSSELLN